MKQPDAPGDYDEPDETAVTLPPFVEIELVYESGKPSETTREWRALELWTKNTIYSVDWSMRCIKVQDRATGKDNPKSKLLGRVLTGGQVRNGDEIDIVFPCPRPGCEAVFESPDRKSSFVTTSTIVKAVLRLRVLTVRSEEAASAWSDLARTGQFTRD
jgi:hypothetical protein